MYKIGDKISTRRDAVVIGPWKVEPYTDDQLVLYTCEEKYLLDWDWVDCSWFVDDRTWED